MGVSPASYEPTPKLAHSGPSKRVEGVHEVTEASLAFRRMCAWSFLHVWASYPYSSLSIRPVASLILDDPSLSVNSLVLKKTCSSLPS